MRVWGGGAPSRGQGAEPSVRGVRGVGLKPTEADDILVLKRDIYGALLILEAFFSDNFSSFKHKQWKQTDQTPISVLQISAHYTV